MDFPKCMCVSYTCMQLHYHGDYKKVLELDPYQPNAREAVMVGACIIIHLHMILTIIPPKCQCVD